MTTTSDINICNTGLLLIGADEITSFIDETREAKICNQLYSTARDTLLQKNIWRFALKTVQLSKITTPSENIDEFGFKNEFLVPSDSLRIIATDDPSDDYIIVADKILSNREDIRVMYQYVPNESKFPSYFRSALELELTAKFSLALAEDTGKYDRFRIAADLELIKAKNIDSQGQPVQTVGAHNLTLTSVRY